MDELAHVTPPNQPEPEGALYGTLDAWREDIARNAAGAAVHAQLAITYAQIGNDAGLTFALKCLVACVRAAIGSLSNLQEDKQRQQAENPS